MPRCDFCLGALLAVALTLPLSSSAHDPPGTPATGTLTVRVLNFYGVPLPAAVEIYPAGTRTPEPPQAQAAPPAPAERTAPAGKRRVPHTTMPVRPPEAEPAAQPAPPQPATQPMAGPEAMPAAEPAPPQPATQPMAGPEAMPAAEPGKEWPAQPETQPAVPPAMPPTSAGAPYATTAPLAAAMAGTEVSLAPGAYDVAVRLDPRSGSGVSLRQRDVAIEAGRREELTIKLGGIRVMGRTETLGVYDRAGRRVALAPTSRTVDVAPGSYEIRSADGSQRLVEEVRVEPGDVALVELD